MPLVVCPRCSREIQLSLEDLQATLIECAACGTRFGLRGVLPQPAVAPAPVDDRDEPDQTVSYAPVPRRRSPALGLAIGGTAFIVLACCGVGGFLAASANKDARAVKAARPLARPTLPSVPLLDPDPVIDPILLLHDREAAANQERVWTAVVCVLAIIYLITLILLLAWVARDTRARGVDGGAVWVLVILLTWVIGLLVYLASRPQGKLAPCQRCGNRRLQMALVCPHCGQPAT